MRTTVSIDDRLLTQAKVAAAGSGRTLSDLVEDGLRLLLAQGGRHPSAPVVLPVFGGSGLLPGVDLEDKDGLAARLDESDDARAAG
ncbi:MAG: antitoxin [Mycobacteriales bacterium]|nr:antitoxin [Mycobacteriales bacterium]